MISVPGLAARYTRTMPNQRARFPTPSDVDEQRRLRRVTRVGIEATTYGLPARKPRPSSHIIHAPESSPTCAGGVSLIDELNLTQRSTEGEERNRDPDDQQDGGGQIIDPVPFDALNVRQPSRNGKHALCVCPGGLRPPHSPATAVSPTR